MNFDFYSKAIELVGPLPAGSFWLYDIFTFIMILGLFIMVFVVPCIFISIGFRNL